MKASKLIIAVSELWSDDQLVLARSCLLRGLEQISNRVSPLNVFDGVDNCVISENIALENCDVEVLVRATRAKVVSAVRDALRYDNSLILYVGDVTMPFGQWLLTDGLFHADSLVAVINGGHGDERKEGNTCVLATMAPCDDWQHQLVGGSVGGDKKHVSGFHLCSYQLSGGESDGDDGGDDDRAGLWPGVSRFVDGLCQMLTVSARPLFAANTTGTLVTRNPSIYFFLDRGCPTVPALLALDGFAMLLNAGYNRNPDSLRYLRHYQQIDVALVSNVGYNNVLGLGAFSAGCGGGPVKLNHLLLPPGTDIVCEAKGDAHNPFHVDLKSQMNAALTELRNGGTQCSTMSVKAKSGTALSANHVKPIQLFHKIGYGSLELIPLSPFEDDPEVKKFIDDWKKAKYANDSLLKCISSAVSVLIIWKPFNNKAPIKRVLYIGSKCPIKKCFPTVLAALLGIHDCLKQSEYIPSEGLTKKAAIPRKGTPPVANSNVVSKSAHAKTNDNIPATSTASSNKKPGAGTIEKSSRPSTAANTATHNSKEESLKRPQTATSSGKQKSDTVSTKPTDTSKKPATTAAKSGTAIPSVASKKPTATKRPESVKTGPAGGHQKEGAQHKIKGLKTNTVDSSAIATARSGAKGSNAANGGAVAHVVSVPNGDHQQQQSDGAIGSNGHNVRHEPIETHDFDVDGDGVGGHSDLLADTLKDVTSHKPDTSVSGATGKMMATVGTVECAITEHGEADFCDDTPEELSAAQMRELGMYDDEDDEKGRAVLPSSDHSQEIDESPGIGNIAHLPMDSSFYGKDTVEAIDGNEHLDWNQPLAMPAPVKDGSAAANAAKKGAKSPVPIHVDCLCVPCDLDKEDLRCLFEYVKFKTGFLQLDKPEDLTKFLDMFLEEREKDGVTNIDSTIIPAVTDESFSIWTRDNGSRLQSCLVTVATDLTHCSIATDADGDHGNDSCLGMKLEL